MNIYDKLLGGIGIALVAMAVGFFVLPPIGLALSVFTLGLVGAAMFVFTPTDTTPVAPNTVYHSDD